MTVSSSVQLKTQASSATPELKGGAVTAFEAQAVEVEHWLRDYGVSYSSLTSIPLEDIDERASRANQARSTPLVEDSVTRFAQFLRDGKSLPPIVVYVAGQKAVIIDGNNRHAAHKRAGLLAIPAFIVAADTPSETILLMTVAANAHHGVTPDLQWRLQQALHLYALNFTAEQAAKAAAVTLVQFQQYQRQQKATVRAAGLKIRGFADLPTVTKTALNVLSSDVIFAAAARTVLATGMNGQETRDMVRDLKSLAPQGDLLMKKYIAELDAQRKLEKQAQEQTNIVQPVLSPKRGLVTGLGKIMAADAKVLVPTLLTADELRDFIRRAEEAGEHLVELQIAFETALKDKEGN